MDVLGEVEDYDPEWFAARLGAIEFAGNSIDKRPMTVSPKNVGSGLKISGM